MAGPSERDIEDRLYLLAVGTALGYGRAFHEHANQDVRRIIADAAAEVLQPSRLGSASQERAQLPLDQRIAEAERAVVLLVQLMAQEAETIPNYFAYSLGEQTLAGAFNRFCPCWPFC